MHSRVSRKGQARVFEAVIACSLVIAATSYAIYYLYPLSHVVTKYEGLSNLAESILLYLSQTGFLDKCIYLENYEKLQQVLEQLLPEGVEFQLSVYKPSPNGWKECVTISSPLFHRCASVSSSSVYLVGFNGTLDERLVILSLGG